MSFDLDVFCQSCRASHAPCDCPGREVDRRIRALCREKGLRFRPWEPEPWAVPSHGSCQHPGWVEIWPKAQELRRRLLAELGIIESPPAKRRGRGAAT